MVGRSSGSGCAGKLSPQEPSRMTDKPRTIDEYLATVSEEKRADLEHLRALIHSAAPGAEECISYGVSGLRLAGKLLVSFGAPRPTTAPSIPVPIPCRL